MWGAVAATEMALADEAENLLDNEEVLAVYCSEVEAMIPAAAPSASGGGHGCERRNRERPGRGLR